MTTRRSVASIIVALSVASALLAGQTAPRLDLDLVIAGGRVIDPESGLDAIRDIGIRGDRIVVISEESLDGRDRIDALGLVVSPGFIDLHRHAVGDRSYGFAARDGVTSAFELEIGAPDVEAWYRLLGPARLINFGVSAGHIGVRMAVLGDEGFLLPTGPARGPATPDQLEEILAGVAAGLEAGAVAVGIPAAYMPGASTEELAAVVALAGRHGALVSVHLGGGREGAMAALAVAAAAGTPLHIAHANSTAGPSIAPFLEGIRTARAAGQDVTTEVYPYTAGATLIQSALYDDWESWPEDRFARMQWAATGEWLTRGTFGEYRKTGGSVISHSNTEEALRIGLADPLPMIASDGGRDLEDNPTHPRASGTFARVLGKYVRDEQVLTLNDALRRMTIEPARRLESRVPEMAERGRIREGAFADITVFDPATVIDRSTYTNPAQYSQGILYVIVNGTPVVRGGDFADRGMLQGVPVLVGTPKPGRPIRAGR